MTPSWSWWEVEVDEAYPQYRLVMGADPVKETEPTAEH